MNPGLFKDIGKGPFEHLPVFKDIGDSGGTTKVIFKDVEAAVTITYKIGSGDVAPYFLGRGKTFTLLSIGLAAQDQVLRYDFVFKDFLVVIDVLEKLVECKNPLF